MHNQSRSLAAPELSAPFDALPCEEECTGLKSLGPEPPHSLRSVAPSQGFGIAWASFENHPPQPPRFILVAPLLGDHGEVAQGQVTVDALIDTAETIGPFQRQDSPPASFGLGRLAGFAMHYGLAEVNLGVIGVEPQALGTAPSAAGRSPSI